jgi:hypothetical protein
MRGRAAGFNDMDRDDGDDGDFDDACTPTLLTDVGTIVKVETDDI